MTSKVVTAKLWEEFGEPTITTLADGAVTSAMLRESAWTEGNGIRRFNTKQLIAISRAVRQELWEDDQHPFVPSLDLDAIGNVLK